MQREHLEALDRLRSDTSVRALLISAKRKGFCVGAHLSEFGRRAAESRVAMGELMEKGGNPLVAGVRARVQAVAAKRPLEAANSYLAPSTTNPLYVAPLCLCPTID
jgi:enoyl-CoA hydratase/carnithine racemase